MADIEVRRIHGLGLEAARGAAERFADDLGRRYGLRSAWDGDVLRFERPGLDGALALAERDLRITVRLAGLLRAMKGPIERGLVEVLDELFPERA